MREDTDTEDRDRGPEEVFRVLKDRPTPELNTAAAWTRVKARMHVPPPGLGARVRGLLGGGDARVWRWAPVGLAAIAFAVGWLALAPPVPLDAPVAEVPADLAGGRDLVLLADADDQVGGGTTDAAGRIPPVATGFQLDARLVRGYEGVTPADAMSLEASGAGGADPMADLTSTLSGVVPTPEFALVGRWQGEVSARSGAAAATEATLSDRHRLSYRVERTATGLRLLEVRFLGEGAPLIADQIDLEPGRLYVFGAGGADSDLVLALRLDAVAARSEDDAPGGTDPAQE